MANPPVVVAAPKKSGLGCCGCGCAILALIVLLIVGLVGAVGYYSYEKLVGLTSPLPGTVASFDGGDAVFNGAREKVEGFDHNLRAHQPATIHLTADEINTLIARNPQLVPNGIRVFVAMNGDLVRIDESFPTSLIGHGMVSNRYFNGSTTFKVHFDNDQKAIVFDPQSLQVGEKVVFNQAAGTALNATAEDANKQSMIQTFTPIVNEAFNAQLQKDPAGQEFLKRAKTVEVKDGELTIEIE